MLRLRFRHIYWRMQGRLQRSQSAASGSDRSKTPSTAIFSKQQRSLGYLFRRTTCLFQIWFERLLVVTSLSRLVSQIHL